jgi:triacylglycerol lipase
VDPTKHARSVKTVSTHRLQLKYPIVLVHGLGARNSYGPYEYFYGLPKLLRDAKNQVFIPNMTAWHTIEHRAQQLKKQIEKAFPGASSNEKFNLVGHSMGGLDARYLASQLGMADRIASITTIGTPNRGSTMGDLATGLLPTSAFLAADRFLQLMESSSGALKQITRSYCNKEFAALTPNQPQVAYFSATTAIINPIMKNSLPIFWIPHRILTKTEGDNDGFVSVDSAQWGDHICTHSGDHYAQIGQFFGRSRGMDYLKFYDEIFNHLKTQGM